MARRGKSDVVVRDVRLVQDALRKYAASHPSADIQVRRQNSVSIRIRIIDLDFEGTALVERDTQLWDILDPLPEEVRSQITMLLLLTPKEAKTSFANMEFDHLIESAF